MGAFNQLQGQGLGMANDLGKTTDDLKKKVGLNTSLQQLPKTLLEF